MSRLSQVDRLMVYEDTEVTNDPKKVLIDFSLEVSKVLTSCERHDISKSGAFTYLVPLSSARTFLAVLSDNNIVVRLNGEVDNNIAVSPSIVGTKDGYLYKRGSFTALEIVYTGTGTTNVTIMVGA